jgi:AraC family transcriptional regulator, transcriptional activator FtrA
MSVAAEVFGLHRPEFDPQPYTFTICAPDGEAAMRDGVFRLSCDADLRATRRADTVIVPNRPDPLAPADPRVLQAIRSAHRRGARLVSFCTGAFNLAAAGVVDEVSVACHWRWADELRRQYPHIDVRSDVLYVDNGSVASSAGSAAALDLCLHLVQRDHGVIVAQSVSRRLVFAVHRDGGQRQFIERPRLAQSMGSSDGLAMALSWAEAHLDLEISVATLASRAAMSVSSLHRVFHTSMGTTPLRWLQRARVTAALELLQSTDLDLATVARHCGFRTVATLRTYVSQETGLTPSAFRSRWRDPVPAG